jgi:hypothetical protein
MPFKLRITFAGLCMLVPDKTRLHVLLPSTHDHDGHGIEPHVTMLKYHPDTNPDVWLDRDIDQTRWEFTPKDSDPLPGDVRGVTNVSQLFGAKVPKKFLQTNGSLAAALSAHFVFNGGGKITISPDKGRWHGYISVGSAYRRIDFVMAPWIVWETHMDDDVLDMRRAQTLGLALPKVLEPIGDVVELEVHHVAEGEYSTHSRPAEPPVGGPALHFRTYYPLVGRAISDEPLPMWDGLDVGSRNIEGMSPYTCMVSSGIA